MSDYDAMVLELAEKHEAFCAPQMLDIVKSQDVPVDELDFWMQAMREWQPCLFKTHVVSSVKGPGTPAGLREYMKKLLARESNAEVERQGTLAERGTVDEGR